MPKLLNVALTWSVLAGTLFVWLAAAYDGYCYGFTDGKSTCSFAEHVAANLAWLPFLLIYFFPHVLIVGSIVYVVNGAIHRAVVRLARRWRDSAGGSPT